MNDIAFKVIIKNDGIDDVIFKTLMLKGEKGDKGDAGGAEIDDTTTSSTKTWSSNKTRNEIDAKPDNLSELDDVDLDAITDEQLLGYNFTTGKWKNKSVDASTLKYDANSSIKNKIDEKANTADLATVATSGEYNDLSNKPNLAEVATSGDYDDLTNKPSIPPAQVNADWNASSGVAEILNKPTIPVVDQTLNSSSSNAISNSAVTNGLSDKANQSDVTNLQANRAYAYRKVSSISFTDASTGHLATTAGVGQFLDQLHSQRSTFNPDIINYYKTSAGGAIMFAIVCMHNVNYYTGTVFCYHTTNDIYGGMGFVNFQYDGTFAINYVSKNPI